MPTTVTSVVVHSALSVDVTFSAAMGTGVTTAANYALTGTGKGTLATNPNSVANTEGNTYRLTWTTGEMVNGGDITITCSTMVDGEDGALGSPAAGTATAGGIGVLPTVASVTVTGTRTVEVAFDAPMGTGATTAANYTVSGTGKGTLAAHPSTVVLKSGSTYTLTWAAGEMCDAGDITITVINAQDAAGNIIAGTNSGTATGEAVAISFPTLVNVVRRTSNTLRIVFSEAMASDADIAANYAATGDGLGTCAATPDTVTQFDETSYSISWTEGELDEHFEVTITVTGVTDAAGNPIDENNNMQADPHVVLAVSSGAGTVARQSIEDDGTLVIAASPGAGLGVTHWKNTKDDLSVGRVNTVAMDEDKTVEVNFGPVARSQAVGNGVYVPPIGYIVTAIPDRPITINGVPALPGVASIVGRATGAPLDVAAGADAAVRLELTL
jgi:hypothetical protein